MIPKTEDGRVLFLVPWHNKVVVGTTDTLLDSHSLEPKPLAKEVDFILETANRYLNKKVSKDDVLSIFAGLRPLAAPKDDSEKTKEISRGHKIYTSEAGLVTITGGKWTTYRQMAEEVVDSASKVSAYPLKKSVTRNLALHGWKKNGWKTAAKKPVKNKDLWQALDEACARHSLNWVWVKGHSGDEGNERADTLARLQSEEMKASKHG